MADFPYNVALGRVAELAKLAGANDAIKIIPLEASGIETDAVLRDSTDLTDVLGGATNEQTTMGRKTAASVTVTVDHTNDRVDVDMADVTWTAASGNAISDVITAHDYDTTGGTDTDIVPLTQHDAAATPAGGDITVQWNAAGFFRAAG